jgi:Holliday junction resolvase
MTEKAFWQQIKRALPYVHWQRIETGTGQGVPDVNGCIGGDEFWLELKIAQGNKVKITPGQIAWLMQRIDAGGKAWIIVKKKEQIFIYNGYQGSFLLDSGLKLQPEATMNKPFDWEDFLRIVRQL